MRKHIAVPIYLLSICVATLHVQLAAAQHGNSKPSGGSCSALVPLNPPVTSPSSTACSNDLTGTCLDATFGGHGLVLTNTDGSVASTHDIDGAAAVKELTDGSSRLVAIGNTNDPQNLYNGVAVVRYHSDGSLDSSFGSGGIATTFFPSSPSDIYLAKDGTVDPNGNVLALAGNAIGVVVRFNSVGMPDTTFNSTGFSSPLNLSPRALLLQPDGKLIVAGSTQPTKKSLAATFFRLNPDGSIDSTFGQGGKTVVTSFPVVIALALESVNSQQYLLAGGQTASGDFGIVRLNLNGTLDSTFGASGLATTTLCGFGGRINSLAVDATGNILAAGEAPAVSGGSQKIAVARFTAKGVVDKTFGSSGQAFVDFYGSLNYPTALETLPDSSFMVAGYADKSVGTSVLHYLVMTKYDANGSLVPAFGTSGAVAIDFGGGNNSLETYGSSNLLIQPDGKPVIAGSAGFTSGSFAGYNFALARLWP